MRIAVAQVAPRPGDLQANLDRAAELIREAVRAGAKLVVFPELSLSGYLIGDRGHLALGATDQRLIAATSSAADASVLLCFPEYDDGAVYNSAVLFTAGELSHVHRKLILPSYPPFTEGERFQPGNELRAFDTPFGRAVVLLCEDVVQPAFGTIAVHDGAELLLLPANSAHSLLSGANNREHWHAITSFYARLAQCFVVFANRVGAEDPFRFWGGSHVRDPRGRIVAQAPDDEEALLLVELDHDDVARQRRSLPLLGNARLDIVGQELDRILPKPPRSRG